MQKKLSYLVFVVFVLFLSACSLPSVASPTITTTPTSIPTNTPTPTPIFTGSYRGSAPDGALARLGKGQIGNFALSPDGKVLAVGYAFGVDLYSSETFQLNKTVTTKAHVWSVSFFNDGKTLIAGLQDGSFSQIDTDSGQIIKNIKTNENGSTFVAYSPNGKYIATNEGPNGENIAFWDLETGNKQKTLKGHSNPIQKILFSPDSSMLISIDRKDNIASMKLWDLQTENNSGGFPEESKITDALFSPDNKTIGLLYSENSTVRIWDIASQKELGKIDALGKSIESLAFSPDGSFLAVGGNDTRIIDLKKYTQVDTINFDGSVSLWYEDNGSNIYIVSGKNVVNLDIKNKRVLKTITGYTYGMNSVSYSKDGSLLATSSRDGDITIWDIKQQKPLKTLVGHSKASTDAVFIQNGELLISAGLDNQVIVWNVKSGEVEKKMSIEGKISSIKISPDEKYVGVLIDQKVELWDWEKSTRIDTIDSSNIGLILKMRDFAFIPGKDELIIGPSSKSLDYGAVLYSFSGSENANIPTGKLLAMLYETSPDGKYLLTGDFDDELKNTLTLWNYDSKEPEHHWILNGFPTNLTFSNDSKYFASAAFDTLVYLWGADSDDTTIKILSGHTEGTTGVSFSPDGSTLASSSYDGSVVLWKIK